MARIQMARDKAMADTVTQAVAQVASPARTATVANATSNTTTATDRPSTGPAIVVLIAGAGHVDRDLGIPQYIPRTVRAVAIRMQPEDKAVGGANTQPFDAIWTTQALPPKDYCAEFKARVAPGAKTE
jgi:hypothetical protein